MEVVVDIVKPAAAYQRRGGFFCGSSEILASATVATNEAQLVSTV